jgi:hypothetical protein
MKQSKQLMIPGQRGNHRKKLFKPIRIILHIGFEISKTMITVLNLIRTKDVKI